MVAMVAIASPQDYKKGQEHNTIALDLSRNQLKKLPNPFYYPQLEELDCSHNKLTTFPVQLINCAYLTRLFLQHNELTSITTLIEHMEWLKVLDVSYNKITELPEKLGYVKKLEYLDVAHNLLTSLPKSLQKLPLTYLHIAANKIREKCIQQWQKKLPNTLTK